MNDMMALGEKSPLRNNFIDQKGEHSHNNINKKTAFIDQTMN